MTIRIGAALRLFLFVIFVI